MEINELFSKVLELEKFSNQTLEDANKKALDIKQSAEKTVQSILKKFMDELKSLEVHYEEALAKEQSEKAENYKLEIEKQSERMKQQFAISLPTIVEWFKKEIEQ